MKKLTVIGAGTAGLVSALLLRRDGYQIDVYEALPDARTQARTGFVSGTVTLSERGLITLDKLGIRNQVERIAMPLSGQQVHLLGVSESRLLPYSHLGEKLWCVSREALDLLLLNVASTVDGITICHDAECTAIDLTTQTVYLTRSRGQEETAALDWHYDSLIVADGARSRVRSLLAAKQELTETFTPSEFRFLEFIIPDTETTRSRFTPGYLQLWPRGNYFVIGFPLQDHSFVGAMFFKEAPDRAPRRMVESFCKDRFHAELADLLEIMPDLWSRIENSMLRQLNMVTVDPWTAGANGVLVGDAAHVILPFLGQGMNAALEDVDLLATLVSDHNHDWNKATKKFSEIRQSDLAALTTLSRAHFERLASTVADVSVDSVIAKEKQMSERYPETFRSLYQLIEFTRTPLVDCERLARELHEQLQRG